MKFTPHLSGALAILLTATALAGDDLPKTLMTERGNVLLSEDFAKPLETTRNAAISKEKKLWRLPVGRWEFVEGGLKGADLKAEHKSAIAIYPFAFKDAVIQFDAQVNGCNRCIFRINDTVEHICRVTLSKDGLTAQKDDHDHAGPDTVMPFGTIEVPFTPGEWRTVLIEIRGSEMVATLDGQSVAGAHLLIDTQKDNIGFGVTGDSASFRRLRIWEALPNKDWAKNKAKLILVK